MEIYFFLSLIPSAIIQTGVYAGHIVIQIFDVYHIHESDTPGVYSNRLYSGKYGKWSTIEIMHVSIQLHGFVFLITEVSLTGYVNLGYLTINKTG